MAVPRADGWGNPQLDDFVGAHPDYNEEEEEQKYYRRKRLGVVKNVLAASLAGTLTYGVYLGMALPLSSGDPPTAV